MRIYITKELAEFHHTLEQRVDRDCLVAQALTMQLPLPDGYHWSVGYTKAYIRDNHESTIETINLSPSVLNVIRNYDSGKPAKVASFQI